MFYILDSNNVYESILAWEIQRLFLCFAVFKSSFATWAPILTALPAGIVFKKIVSELASAVCSYSSNRAFFIEEKKFVRIMLIEYLKTSILSDLRVLLLLISLYFLYELVLQSKKKKQCHFLLCESSVD